MQKETGIYTHIVISELSALNSRQKSLDSLSLYSKQFITFIKKLAEICNVDLKDIIIGNDLNDVDMFKLDCGYKIATGENLPPKELMDLADIYVKLDDLPNFLVEIAKKNNIW